jgi:rubrerythrin
MKKKPPFVQQLEQIVIQERGGHEFFKAWSFSTKAKHLAGFLRTIAIREAEHAWSFEKRLDELGFPMELAKELPNSKMTQFARSSKSDLKKFDAFSKLSGHDFDKKISGAPLSIFEDINMDSHTGSVFGRFALEEKNTIPLLQKEYRRIKKTPKVGA